MDYGKDRKLLPSRHTDFRKYSGGQLPLCGQDKVYC